VCCCTAAARLVAKSEVYCYGQRLLITGCTPVAFTVASERWQRENVSDSSVPELLVDHPAFQESHTELTVAAVALNTTRDDICDSDDDFNIDLNTGWWDDVDMAASPSRQHDVDFDQCVTDCRKLSDTVELQPLSIDSPLLRQCLTLQDDNIDKDLTEIDDDSESDRAEDDKCNLAICKRAVVEQDSNEMFIRPQKSQKRTELVYERLPQNAKANTARFQRSWKINFFEEKLCLLEKMIAAGNVNFPCGIQVIMAENAVELTANEENVTESEIRLYELIANFSSISLHLPSGIVNLLLSSRGKRWLRTQLELLDAVFYAKDSSCPFIIGANDKTSMDAKFLLETVLSSKKILFIDEHMIFLQSAHWAFAIEKLQSEFFVVVNTDHGENVIVLEGSIDALNNVSKSIESMLKQNGRIQRKINMSAAHFQLLMHFRVEIHDKLRSEMSQNQQNRY